MIRGLILGIVWGGLLAGLVLGMASLIAPLPATVDPQTSAATRTTGAIDATGAGPADVSEADTNVEDMQSPEVTTPDPEENPLADTTSAPKPDTGGDSGAINAPTTGSDGSVAVSGDTPVDPAAAADAPAAPTTGDDVSITTNPEQPAPPPVPEVGAFSDTPLMTAPATENSSLLTGGGDDSAPATAATGTAPEVEGGADMTPMAEKESAPAPETGQTSLLTPTQDLKDSFPQHGSDRLPSVAADTTGDETALAPQRPVERFGEPFEDPEGRPLMSIVLIDTGADTAGVEALQSFPYPLSFAIDTLSANANARATAYRKAGFEVLAMIDIPTSAAAADVEVAMAAHLSVLPEAVAVIEGTGEGLQGSRELSDQVTDVLLASGHGLVLHAQGLDTARKLAQRDGVPAVSVFRDFDAKGQNSVVIRRFLDQAAFRAGQEGGVVMVGRLREDTVAALLLWGLQDRAASVALVPVSAVLLAE